jgi:hypothetical protein
MPREFLTLNGENGALAWKNVLILRREPDNRFLVFKSEDEFLEWYMDLRADGLLPTLHEVAIEGPQYIRIDVDSDPVRMSAVIDHYVAAASVAAASEAASDATSDTVSDATSDTVSDVTSDAVSEAGGGANGMGRPHPQVVVKNKHVAREARLLRQLGSLDGLRGL